MFVINIGRLLIYLRDTASQDLVVYYEVKRAPPPVPGYVILSYHLFLLFRLCGKCKEFIRMPSRIPPIFSGRCLKNCLRS